MNVSTWKSEADGTVAKRCISYRSLMKIIFSTPHILMYIKVHSKIMVIVTMVNDNALSYKMLL